MVLAPLSWCVTALMVVSGANFTIDGIAPPSNIVTNTVFAGETLETTASSVWMVGAGNSLMLLASSQMKLKTSGVELLSGSLRITANGTLNASIRGAVVTPKPNTVFTLTWFKGAAYVHVEEGAVDITFRHGHTRVVSDQFASIPANAPKAKVVIINRPDLPLPVRAGLYGAGAAAPIAAPILSRRPASAEKP